MNRIDRLHAILTHLQSKKLVTAQEIADRFNISLRTVYRDVKALDESGVPVIGEAGSGYKIMEGYRLPPVMFSQEEASALLLGAKLAARFTDASVQKQYDAALFKIKSVLRSTDKDHVDNLDDQIAITRPHLLMDESGDRNIVSIQTALSSKKVLRIQYYSAYNEAQTDRPVEPIGLYYYGQAWHLIAWCQLRKDYRDFRVNRIQKIQITDLSFSHKQHQSLQQYIDTVMQEQRELTEACIIFPRNIARYVGDQKYYYGFVREEKCDDHVKMHFLVWNLEYFGRWLLMYTTHVKVEAPAQLTSMMGSLAAKLVEHWRN